MDRMDPGNSFLYPERVRLYHRLVKYWISVLTHTEPDIVVFPNSPHLIFDYVIYSLCQHLGIQTIMFERIGFPGMLFPLEQFEFGSPDIETAYRKYSISASKDIEEKIELSPAMQDHLDKITGNDYSQAIPYYMSQKLDQLNRNSRLGTIGQIKRLIRDLPRMSLRHARHMASTVGISTPSAPLNYLKLDGSNIEHSYMNGVEWRRYKRSANRKKDRMKRNYMELAEPIDLKVPYVFVALNYQPERTTSPLAGVYANPFLMVDLLSKTIPDDWRLYVKEHPLQLTRARHGERSRAPWLYDDIISLPNVSLVPYSIPQFEMIDNAMAVATPTGTVGWESVARGTPALVLGNPWYKGCEGVFYTPTEASCREALAKIASGYKVDKAKVRLFAKALEEVCFRGYVDPNEGNVSGITDEENILSITKALINAINQPSDDDRKLSVVGQCMDN